MEYVTAGPFLPSGVLPNRMRFGFATIRLFRTFGVVTTLLPVGAFCRAARDSVLEASVLFSIFAILMSSEEYKLLDTISSPRELKKLPPEELSAYCDELRRYIIDECAVNPGHLASSLGAVELAAALH